MAYINRRKRVSPRKDATSIAERRKVYDRRQWRRLSDLKKRSNPLCEVCQMEGRVTEGTDVHHIHSFTDGKNIYEKEELAYDFDNLLTVCDSCHNRLHHGDLKGCRRREEIEERIGWSGKKSI